MSTLKEKIMEVIESQPDRSHHATSLRSKTGFHINSVRSTLYKLIKEKSLSGNWYRRNV